MLQPARPRSLILAVLITSAIAASVGAQTTGIREVTASERSLIPLQTRLRYTTMIVLPDGDEILDVICGDRDFWVISAVQNVAHVKPAKAGTETNLNLVTARGAIYSFLLAEKAGTPIASETFSSASAFWTLKPQPIHELKPPANGPTTLDRTARARPPRLIPSRRTSNAGSTRVSSPATSS